MRKIVLLIIFINIGLFIGINNGNAAIVNQLPTRISDSMCTGALVNRVYYLTGATLDRYLIDEMWSSTDRYIAVSTSRISFWESSSNLVTGCRASTDWYRQSEVIPGNNTRVVAYGANCTFNRPTNNNNRTLQFVYNIDHGRITTNGNTTYTKHYSTYSNGIWNSYTKDYANYYVQDYEIHPSECFNVELRYCGDGILETTNGEACDDGNNIDGDGCSATCQLVSPNIDIDKRDANSADLDGVVGNDTQTVNVASGAVFRIRVTNNYTESLRNLVLTDAIAPNCAGSVTLPGTFPSTWTGVTVGGSGDHTNATLEVGEYIDYVCSRLNTTAGYTNSATVTGIGNTSNISVTDTDTTVVLIPGGGGITCGTAGGYSFSYSETVWPTNLTFCSSGATPSPNPPVFPNQGSSTSWTCNGSGSTVNCSASRGNPGGGGGGGGGGTAPTCERISVPVLEALGAGKAISSTGSVKVMCYGNYRAKVIGVDCDLDGNSSTKSITYQETATETGSRKVATFSCNYNNSNIVPRPKCYVTGGGGTVTINSTSALACTTGISVGRNRCGDGVVQRPNSDGEMEECESTNGVFPSWCIACKTTNLTIPGEGGGVLTFPGNGNIYFKPFGQVIVGAGSNPFAVLGVYPFIGNDSSEDLYLDYPLCVHNSDSSALIRSNGTGLSKVCTSQNIGWMYPGVTKTYESLNYGNNLIISGVRLTGNESYRDTLMKITIGDFKDSFFAAPLKVRVSKPAVATLGGGTSLIKNTNVTADINKVAGNGYSDQDKNKNFVGAGVSTGSVSSYTKTVTNTNSVTKASSGQKVQTNLTKVTTTKTSGNKNIGDTLTKYNGLSDVYIVKNGNLTINASISGSGARTYIVEGGNLYINQNITYSDNIAFVVKGGDIIIASNVTKINGTFITMKVNSVGGKIISSETDNKLVVNGSLYGDIESLVNNRTYVENKNNLINVGTVVSFGSSLFRKQAPLVGDFIGEYVKSKKVAK